MRPTVEERRETSRRRVLKTGTISFEGQSFECAVRNLSEVGACLELATPTALPDNFTLFIKTAKMMRHCHVVWRAKRRMGVKFENRPSEADRPRAKRSSNLR